MVEAAESREIVSLNIEYEKLVLNEITLGLLEEDPSNRIPSAEKLRDELASVV